MDILFLLFVIPAMGAALLAALCFALGAALLVSAMKDISKLVETGVKPGASLEPVGAGPTPSTATIKADVPVPPAEPTAVGLNAKRCQCSEEGCSGRAAERDEYADVPGFGFIRKADYETRADGQLVRKDRWETGLRNIAGILTGPRAGFEIEDVVEKVREIAKVARADYASGGNGLPGSAPKWGPCPAKCEFGQVRGKFDEDCPECDGRGQVVVEPPLVLTPTSEAAD